MATITVERAIAAPAEKVFRLATDVPSWPDVVPAILETELLTSGDIGVGTRFRETRVMFGREATEEMEFVAFDPPRGYVVLAESHGCRYRTEFKFVPEGAGTRIVMEFQSTPLTLTAKVLSVLMKPMMKKMADLVGKDLEAIQAHVESAPD